MDNQTNNQSPLGDTPPVDAEQAYTQDRLAKVVPDLVSPKGQKIVQSLIDAGNKVKPKMDNTLKLIAASQGLDPNKDFESRIKDSDVLVKKVAQQRTNGKDGYRANDVNDLYGARFIAKTPEQKKEIIKAVKELDENNAIKIDKAENVHHGTYNAYHVDFNKDGVKGEIQVHDPHSLLESVVNHEIRANVGEKAGPLVEAVKQINAHKAYSLPADQAQQQAQALELIKRMGKKNVDPVLSTAQQQAPNAAQAGLYDIRNAVINGASGEGEGIAKLGSATAKIGADQLKDGRDVIHIADIANGQKGNGNASQLLDEIIKVANKENMPITLVPLQEDKNGLTTQQLIDWYGRKGFKEIPAKQLTGGDYKDMVMMREPHLPQPTSGKKR